MPWDELLPLAVKLLEIPDTIVLDALRLELDAGQVIADQVERRDNLSPPLTQSLSRNFILEYGAF